MERLPAREQERILSLLKQDDHKRNRRDFLHSFEIIEQNWACKYSIWPIPNSDAREVIDKKVAYGFLPVEELNEVQKGMLFEDLRKFIASNINKGQMLCEAIDYEPCIKEKCPLFAQPGSKSGGQYGLCREFKTAFKR
jgi:hypothetical protein